MQIETKKSQKKMITTASIIVILLLGAIALAFQMSYWPFNNRDSTLSPELTANQDNSNVAGQSEQVKDKGPVRADEPTEQVGGDARLTINKLTQEEDQILLKASLENVADSGRCIAYFTSDGGSIAKYATVSTDNENLVCSLEANALEFTYLGTWSVRVVYTTPDEKKIESMGEVVIK